MRDHIRVKNCNVVGLVARCNPTHTLSHTQQECIEIPYKLRITTLSIIMAAHS